MTSMKPPPGHRRWGRFRLGVIGHLLSAPPDKGELNAAILDLASRHWRHPMTGERVKFGASTIQRWFYAAKDADDPVGVLARKPRKDRGTHPSMTPALADALRSQYEAHKSWSYQLHADNLVALAELEALGDVPSYSTVLRHMKDEGLLRRPKPKSKTKGAALAAARVEAAEIRSFEAEYVNQLWHWDFHVGSCRVLLPTAIWATPELFGSLDDYSRLACHIQWSLQENTENLVHGLSQAFQKRGLPRSGMSDCGSAMLASETTSALEELGIVHETTLPLSPYQNAKQEAFWTQVEGRLLPMLEHTEGLTLEQLNEATQAWVEMEYNRSIHSETGEAPIQRYLSGRDVGRDCPSSARLRELFTRCVTRTQRKSDGTVSIEGVRFEVPSRFRHIERFQLRYAQWDLGRALIVDPNTDEVIARLWPLDKTANADGRRRAHQPVEAPRSGSSLLDNNQMAPLMKQLMQEYAALGLPPAYVPKDEGAGGLP